MKFKVGDRARQTAGILSVESPEVTITGIEGDTIFHRHDSGEQGNDIESNFERLNPNVWRGEKRA